MSLKLLEGKTLDFFFFWKENHWTWLSWYVIALSLAGIDRQSTLKSSW